jgi:hypothetical protein
MLLTTCNVVTAVFLRINFITHLLFTASKMTSDAAEVPASINKKHLDILQGIPDGWILRYCTYAKL